MTKAEPIIQRACEFYGVSREDIFRKCRVSSVVQARSVIIYGLFSSGCSLSEIARLLSLHHTSVSAAIARTRDRIKAYPTMREEVERLLLLPAGSTQFEAKLIRLTAKPQTEAFRWDGRVYKAGDYLIIDEGTFAMPKELFEKIFRPV